MTEASPTQRVRVATYNVHGCVGGDGRCDPGRVAGVLNEVAADVVGLQEVAFDDPDGGGQLRELSELTDSRGIASPLFRTPAHWRGNALLTRFEIETVVHHDVSIRNREPRGLLDVRLRIRGGSFRVIVAHFGLRSRERRRQVDALLSLTRSSRADLVAILGDFNEWHPGARALLRMRKALGSSAAPRTYPSLLPLLRLDRIWTSPADVIADCGAHRSRLARQASDHLPAWADMDVPIEPV